VITDIAPESLRVYPMDQAWPVVTPFRAATGVAALVALLGVFAIPRGNSVQAPREPSRFDEAIADASIYAPTKKGDMAVRVIEIAKPDLQQASFDPRPVKTERVTPETPAQMPPIVRVEDDAKPVRRRYAERSRGRDVCASHGLRKVTIGKRWRCKK
jgi:hypothetical protein